MQITFLGTGAAPSYPLPFCHCPNCTQARKNGGKDLRKRSSVMINDDLLIDMGPDLMSACAMHGRNAASIRYHLQTHAHSDHFDPQLFSTRAPQYTYADMPELQVYGSLKSLTKMAEMVKTEGYVDDFLKPEAQQQMRLQVFPVRPLQVIRMGAYTVTAFATNHDAEIESLSYVVEQDGIAVYYCTDTDTLPEETWAGLHSSGRKLDLLILDHTYGPGADSGGHLTAERFIGQIARMRNESLLKDGAKIYATHISHEGNPPHEEFCAYAAPLGFDVAFDGLTITL